MHHDMLFWILLIVVSTTGLVGATAGALGTLTRSVLICLLTGAAVAGLVTMTVIRHGLDGGGALVAAASFMFFSVIAVALTLLVHRIRRHRQANRTD